MRGKIMIIDQDPSGAERLLAPLADAGYEVVAPADHSDAVEVFAREKPDLALIDGSLPDGGSGALCRLLKSSEHGAATPIAVVVARGATGIDLPPVEECGCERLIESPVEDDELVRLCGQLIAGAASSDTSRAVQVEPPVVSIDDLDTAAVDRLVEEDLVDPPPAEFPRGREPGEDAGADIAAHLDSVLGNSVPPAAGERRSREQAPPGPAPSLEEAIDDVLNFDHEAAMTAATAVEMPAEQSAAVATATPPAAPARPRFQTETVTRGRNEQPARIAPKPRESSGDRRRWLAVAAIGAVVVTLLSVASLRFVGTPSTPPEPSQPALPADATATDDDADLRIASSWPTVPLVGPPASVDPADAVAASPPANDPSAAGSSADSTPAPPLRSPAPRPLRSPQRPHAPVADSEAGNVLQPLVVEPTPPAAKPAPRRTEDERPRAPVQPARPDTVAPRTITAGPPATTVPSASVEAAPVDPPQPEPPAAVEAAPVDPPQPEPPAAVEAAPVDPPQPEPSAAVETAPVDPPRLEPPKDDPSTPEAPVPTTASPDTIVADSPARPAAAVAEPDGSAEQPPVKPVVTEPVLIQRAEPAVSPKALKRSGGGVVVLRVLVGEQGTITRVVVDKGIPGSELEAAAINAVLRWKYEPATRDGTPIKAWSTARFEFEQP